MTKVEVLIMEMVEGLTLKTITKMEKMEIKRMERTVRLHPLMRLRIKNNRNKSLIKIDLVGKIRN